uniref:Uncharacterized protein n=1 Tax=Oryza brachyantha TaxID=4533 RepID=J3LKA2_ORYBR
MPTGAESDAATAINAKLPGERMEPTRTRANQHGGIQITGRSKPYPTPNSPAGHMWVNPYGHCNTARAYLRSGERGHRRKAGGGVGVGGGDETAASSCDLIILPRALLRRVSARRRPAAGGPREQLKRSEAKPRVAALVVPFC